MLGGETPRILLVDDDDNVRKAYARVLGASGFKVDTAAEGAEAVSHLTARSYDVVLSDIFMPGMDGLEVLRIVRTHDLDVPVVLMTGGPAVDTAIKAIQYGAFQYLTKPVDPKELVELCRRATKMHGIARLKRQALELMGQDEKALGDRAAIEARFARAIEKIWVAYHPIISWQQKAVIGFEALLRSDEPTLASPAELLGVAERLHRLHDIGRTVRAQVAATAHQAPASVSLYVNIHPDDLLDDELYQPSSPLAAVAPRVVLEITERATLDDVKDLKTRMRALRDLGYRVAVDDLGAGYAGLTSLTQLEPEVVKLDMSLVREVHNNVTKQQVIRSITRLCVELGMTVITEGVETADERDTLAGLGGDLFQGFLFARPGRGFPTPVL
ncbi:MAG: EAL domain-containing protein [Acidobacteriota bacterium]